MNIDFDPFRWEKMKETYGLWWEGKLNRPIVPVVLTGKDPGRLQPSAPLLTQATCTDFTISPEDIVDRLDYELSTRVYLGDAFPYISMDCFGPGVAAAFCGARLENSTGRVWFHAPNKDMSICDIHLEYDGDNIWLNRIKDICAAAMKRWQGQVLVSMTDLGGTVDILSTFRPSERLMFDLYDHPEEVKRLTWEAHELWHRFYQEINEVLQPVNPGYSDWSSIYSDRPGYILQCDFCYMIGPNMFDEFVKPELEASCRKILRPFYHLDGPGQLVHLDALLEIDELLGIQWIPGEGNPDCRFWPEVYQKIHNAGKKIQVAYGGFDAIDTVMEQIGTGQGIQHREFYHSIADESKVRQRLARYGIE